MGDNPSAKIDAAEKRHARSYELLEQAREAAKKSSEYDSLATRRKMSEECKRRAGFEPKKEQLDIAESMLLGLDSTVMAATGWGKSVPFALPLFVRPGKTIIVISPLNDDDQVGSRLCVNVGLLMLWMPGKEKVKKENHDIIIVGPKLCLDPDGAFRPLLRNSNFTNRILAVVMDEANCIAQWGTTFALRTDAPVHAASATLTPAALTVARRALHIRADDSFHLNLGNDRPNIAWEVRLMNPAKSDLESLDFVLGSEEDLDKAELLPRSVVFFDDVEMSLQALRRLRSKVPERLGNRICMYNPMRSALSNQIVFKLFQQGRVDILLATEAAGMSFDVSDIPLVVQFLVPSSLETWMRRAGRAGRNKDIRARAILLVQPTVFREEGKKTRQPGDPRLYVEEIKPDLLDWITASEGECRRAIADRVFDNPPREAPTGSCCDNCEARTVRAEAAERRESEEPARASDSEPNKASDTSTSTENIDARTIDADRGTPQGSFGPTARVAQADVVF
ncbi:P-loop containing nucleoside triphosphate hydrolase protein [Epithele typhae]|uniref:P-loop containing nucleoside triphosphate hydrolase protein n=1 Tax=Epithele typhae TaxID=378194 RepID=UPI00200838F5|nr:P-loop containing nucleoside triphosphate hydrolase protein [Epithele typhae]KAH9918379.1 P-loop containing nucleoside triphosphate hydrolase protein [Epithele typhae]